MKLTIKRKYQRHFSLSDNHWHIYACAVVCVYSISKILVISAACQLSEI
jgi:hypothetical protein